MCEQHSSQSKEGKEGTSVRIITHTPDVNGEAGVTLQVQSPLIPALCSPGYILFSFVSRGSIRMFFLNLPSFCEVEDTHISVNGVSTETNKCHEVYNR